MPSKSLFRSAFGATAPTPDELLAFHRRHFGASVMEAEEEPGGEAAEEPKPNGPNGFPEETPVSEMTDAQKAAYGRHMRELNRLRREAFDKAMGGPKEPEQVAADYEELARLRKANLTDAERAIEDARTEARTEAERDVSAKYQARLVGAELKAALAAVSFPADKIAGQVEFIDHTKFLTSEGEVDTDKVTQYAAGLAPTGGHWPDMGGGYRGDTPKAKGVSAGADMFAASRGKST